MALDGKFLADKATERVALDGKYLGDEFSVALSNGQ